MTAFCNYCGEGGPDGIHSIRHKPHCKAPKVVDVRQSDRSLDAIDGAFVREPYVLPALPPEVHRVDLTMEEARELHRAHRREQVRPNLGIDEKPGLTDLIDHTGNCIASILSGRGYTDVITPVEHWSLSVCGGEHTGFIKFYGRAPRLIEPTPRTATQVMQEDNEIRTCLHLLVRQIEERSASLPGVPDLLCAIDKQTLARAKKALRP